MKHLLIIIMAVIILYTGAVVGVAGIEAVKASANMSHIEAIFE